MFSALGIGPAISLMGGEYLNTACPSYDDHYVFLRAVHRIGHTIRSVYLLLW
jgi:hypothetical protein